MFCKDVWKRVDTTFNFFLPNSEKSPEIFFCSVAVTKKQWGISLKAILLCHCSLTFRVGRVGQAYLDSGHHVSSHFLNAHSLTASSAALLAGTWWPLCLWGSLWEGTWMRRMRYSNWKKNTLIKIVKFLQCKFRLHLLFIFLTLAGFIWKFFFPPEAVQYLWKKRSVPLSSGFLVAS